MLLTIALTTWISAAEFALLHRSHGRVAIRGIRNETKEPERRTSAARLVDTKKVLLQGKELVPGVILRPKTQHRKQEHVMLLPTSARGLLLSRPMTIPFTGEYHLFPTSSGQVQSDSAVYIGTPLDAAYINYERWIDGDGGLPAITSAYRLHKLREARTYRAKWRAIASLATVHLNVSKRIEEIGSELFGFEPGPTEILRYDAPSVLGLCS